MGAMRGVVLAVVVVLSSAAVAAEQAATSSTFRLFLTDGNALPIYGDYALVEDRVVFMLIVGPASPGTAAPALHLMSLPVTVVDLDRSARYATAVRASHYAATWGEADYAAITAEVESAVAYLAGVQDPGRRIVLAEQARERLLAWSAAHFSYRSADIRRLATLFDEVIAELRTAAGESPFAFDLVARPPVPVPEALLPDPDARSALTAAQVAARAADLGPDRLAVLDAALAASADRPGLDDLRGALRAEIVAEREAETAYAALEADLVALADRAMRAGDPAGVDTVLQTLAVEDVAFGQRRPAAVVSLEVRLRTMRNRASAHRLALDRYVAARPRLLDYERRVRRSMSTLDGQEPVLRAIRDDESVSVATLDRAEARLRAVTEALAAAAAPDELTDVHATLVSAARMAIQACDERRLAIATTVAARARTASAAAAGSLLLSANARASLVERLFPPVFR